MSGTGRTDDEHRDHTPLIRASLIILLSPPPIISSFAFRLKICDFGYSKSALDSQPKSTVGTPAYIAPEVLQRKEYDGKAADVWSCG